MLEVSKEARREQKACVSHSPSSSPGVGPGPGGFVELTFMELPNGWALNFLRPGSGLAKGRQHT